MAPCGSLWHSAVLCGSLWLTVVCLCLQWALAKDATGNYYYYNMSNSQMTVRELPSVNDTVSHMIIHVQQCSMYILIYNVLVGLKCMYSGTSK